MNLEYFFEKYLKNKKDQDQINFDRQKILNKFDKEKIVKINRNIIKKIFNLIDKYIFNDSIKKKIKDNGYTLDFETSNRYKNIAGTFSARNSELAITFSKKILDNLFKENVKRVTLGGIYCHNLLETLVNIMEHEITHMILFLLKNHELNIGEEKSGHTITFKKFMYNLYGHTQISHSLNLGDIDEHHKNNAENREKLKIGNRIKCKKYEGIMVDIKESIGIFKIADFDFRSCFLKEIEIISNEVLDEKLFMEKIKIGNKLNIKLRGRYVDVEIIVINNKTVRVKEIDTGKMWNLSIWYFK